MGWGRARFEARVLPVVLTIAGVLLCGCGGPPEIDAPNEPGPGTVDGAHMKDYAAAARTRDGFRDYLERHVMGARQAA